MWGLWGMTARRARTQPWALLAALLSVCAASAALTTIAAFASATRDQTVTRLVRLATPDQTRIRIRNTAGDVDPAAAQTALTHDVRTYLPELPAQTDAVFSGDPVEAELGAATQPLTRIAPWASEQAGAHIRMLRGRAPAGTTGSAIEVAVAQDDAAAHHLTLGSGYPFASPLGRGTFTVVGIYRFDSAADPFAALPRPPDGQLPVLINPQDFDGGAIPVEVCTYLVVPDLGRLTGGSLAATAASVHTLNQVLGNDQNLGASSVVESGLEPLLRGGVQALAVARTGIAVPCVLLLAVAGCALAFAARLLAAGRRAGTALMLARGATARQLAGCGALEAFVLCGLAQIPAVLLAAPLAGPVSSAGPVPGFGTAVLGAAAAAWLVGTAALAWCAGQRPVEAERVRGGVAVARGLEIALIVLGGLALWELASHGPADAAQGLIDPVVVLAPAIAVLACAVLSVRLIPLLGRAILAVGSRARGWSAPYGVWSAARAGRAAGGPVVLLVMAIGTVVLAGGYLSASERSALDQADYAVGADVRVTDVSDQAAAVAGAPAVLPYVSGAAEVTRLTAAIGADGSLGPTRILVADPAALARAGRLRADLGPGGIRALTEPLRSAAASGRIAPEPGFTLPGKPRTVDLDLALSGSAAATGGSLQVIFAAEAGQAVSLYLPVSAGSSAHVRVPLSSVLGSGADVAWPLRLTRLNLLISHPVGTARPGLAVRSVTADGTPVALGGADTWKTSGSQDRGTSVVSAVATPRAPVQAIGAVATPGFLAATGKHVGDTAVIEINGTTIPVRIYGRTGAIPTVAPSANGLLLDQADADAYAQSTGSGLIGTLEWWLTAQPGRIHTVAAEVAKVPGLGGTVADRLAVRADYATDPARSGPAGALRIAAVAVALLGLVGFATRLVDEVRTRAREIAVARALGLEPAHVALAFGIQQALETAVALCAGCLAGSVLAERIVPITIVATDGTAAVPKPVAVPPWPEILGSAGVAAACVVAAAALFGIVASRRPIGDLLRTESAAGR